MYGLFYLFELKMKMYCICYFGFVSFIVWMIFYFFMDCGWVDMCLLFDYWFVVGFCCGLGVENISFVRYVGMYF